jgi:hypothetical protein
MRQAEVSRFEATDQLFVPVLIDACRLLCSMEQRKQRGKSPPSKQCCCPHGREKSTFEDMCSG